MHFFVCVKVFSFEVILLDYLDYTKEGSWIQVCSLLNQLTTSTPYFSGAIRNEAF